MISEEISFEPITKFKRGSLFDLVSQSYQHFIGNQSIKNKNRYLEDWKRFDAQSFDNPNIGKCVFVTCLDGKPVGVASYDPRNFPEFGVIGQNCVLPGYQGQGIGKRQILELLRVFKENHCRVVKVTTGDHPFFLSAQKMYLSCGFKEVNRHREKGKDFSEIDYELKLL